jgi:hypothetical protein
VQTEDGTYYAEDGEVQASPGRPIQPRSTYPIASGDVSGALLWSANYTDIPGFDPVIARPVWDLDEPEPIFNGQGWFPIQFWTTNTFGEEDRLVIVGGQFNNEDSTERLYNQVNVEILFRPDGAEDLLPPAVNQAWSELSEGGLTFYVDAVDVATDVARVLVTYNTPGQWQSEKLSLDADSGLWSATVLDPDLDINTEFFVQAVDTDGNMIVASEGGQYYVDGLDNQIVNMINDPHTFTITTYADIGDGDGVQPINDVNPEVVLTRSDGTTLAAETDTCATYGTGHEGVDDGECLVTFVSSIPGSVDVTASIDFDWGLGLSATATTSAMKVYYASQLAPTQTTCQDFTDGTADDIDAIYFGAKDGLINSASPGVFYYYNTVVAPSREFNMIIRQDSIPGFALFEVQNEQQVRLYNADCSTSKKAKLSFFFQDGDVLLTVSGVKAGHTYVISVKYDTNSIVGEVEPGDEILYLYETVVEGVLSGKDHLILIKR